MGVVCVASFVEVLSKYYLLEPSQLNELKTRLQPLFPEPRDLARELIRLDWLTPYQVNQIFLGRGQDLLLGQYVLLQRLGEGGMGQVFKARHRGMDRIVALKLLRKQMVEEPQAVRRFRREMEACAQLSHPNIVRALDADEAAGTYFLVMEYIDGIDLARLVQERGPLPVAQACDYVRQAAVGLQHAYERGMVHRDVKPHNLLVTPTPGKPGGSSALLRRTSGVAGRWGTIKILDMGLARLRDADNGDSTLLTKIGTVMGTPDYIAPEQAIDSHRADIRADLYSLGCTFYYLLAGQVPFPLGSLTDKLLHHQLDEPIPVEEVRREVLSDNFSENGLTTSDARLLEVPPRVAALVKKLMAKKPEERVQTPAELADTLQAMLDKAESSSISRKRLRGRPAPRKGEATIEWKRTPCAAAESPKGVTDEAPEVGAKRLLPWWAGGAGVVLMQIIIGWLAAVRS